MCGRKSNQYSLLSGRLCKVVLVSSLVLFLSVLPLAAWWGGETKEPVTLVPQETKVPTVEILTESTDFSINSKNESNPSLEILAEIQAGKKISAEQEEKLIQLQTEMNNYFAVEALEDEMTENRITELEKNLKKETRPKFFANIGAVYNLGALTDIGFSTNVGMRLGKGFLMSAGAQLNSMKNLVTKGFELDNLSATFSVGWEW